MLNTSYTTAFSLLHVWKHLNCTQHLYSSSVNARPIWWPEICLHCFQTIVKLCKCLISKQYFQLVSYDCMPFYRGFNGTPLQWRHNEHDDVSDHRCIYCLLNYLFKRRSKKTSKLRVTGLCEENPPVTGGFPSQRASKAENVSIWWRHYAFANRGRM